VATVIAAATDDAVEGPASTQVAPDDAVSSSAVTSSAPLPDDHGLILVPQAPKPTPRSVRAFRRAGLLLDRFSARASSKPVILAALTAAVAGLAMAWNIQGYPRVKEDEGITSYTAYSILHGTGNDAIFTFRHMPGAPLMLAGWDRLVDMVNQSTGWFTSMSVIDRGRLLMVVLAIIEAPLMFYIVRRLTGIDLLATGAAILFSLSPLELWYARWLEPDPFAGFWSLFALALALPPARGKGNPLRALMAGLMLGAAIFSKEIAILLAPGVGLMILGWPRGRRFLAVPLLIAGTAVIPGGFLVWLYQNHELFVNPGHASFVGVMLDQAGRQHDGGLFSTGSQFYTVKNIWGSLQPFFITLSLLGSVWLTGFGRSVARRGLGLMALAFWPFFASGLIVQDYYVAAAVPVWTVAAVLAVVDFCERDFVQKRLWGFGLLARAGGLGTVVFLLLMAPGIPADALAFGAQDAKIQTDATLWLRENVSPQAAIVDDGSDSLDLRGSTLAGHDVPNVCNYYDTSCPNSAGVKVAYIVDSGLLNYLAQQDPTGSGKLRAKALSGTLVWSAEGLTDNNFIHIFRVDLTTGP
jgi:hypothetical protein